MKKIITVLLILFISLSLFAYVDDITDYMTYSFGKSFLNGEYKNIEFGEDGYCIEVTYGFHFGSINEKTAVGIGSALDFNFGTASGTEKRYLNWSLLCGPAAKIHLTDSIKFNANVGLGLLVIDHKFCGKSYENESFIGPAYNFELFIHPAQNEVFAFLLSSSGFLGLGEESWYFSSSVTAGFNISIGMGYFPYLFPFWVMAEG